MESSGFAVCPIVYGKGKELFLPFLGQGKFSCVRSLQPATALNGILMLAGDGEAYTEATTELLQRNSDAESLAWRLLEVQGFVNAENETLLAYL